MTAWWSEERIRTTVKQDYIERELGSKRHVEKLHGVLAFGDGLTDDTYLDWILERSPRIFLILNQIGVPDKIFEFIDKSFADDDLPLLQDALWELNLFGGKSETLDKKFYREQFNFLVQELEPGGHVDYGAWDVVPVEPISPVIRRPSIAATQDGSEKVQANKKLYTRRKIASPSEKGLDEVPFLMNLKSLTNLQHAHLVSIWATYSQDDIHFILLQPPAETTLKSFLAEPPKTFKQLEKVERREIFLSWVYCLTSALTYLHGHGLLHQSLRPSSILVDHKYAIFLNDYSALKNLEVEETNSPYSSELYEYSAPENWFRKPCLHETAPLKIYLPGGGRTTRRIPKPAPPTFKHPLPLPSSPEPQPIRRTDSKSASSGSSTNTRPRNAIITTLAPMQREGSISSSSSHQKRGFAADVFSLTAVLVTILSQILQYSPKQFASHRSRLNRQAGRGNAPPDCSFHKNLPQVTKWIDMLVKEAGQREKKDQKFWGAVVEVLGSCRSGIRKDPRERVGIKELDGKIAGWVHWGLARRRKCNCKIKEEEEPSPPSIEVIDGISDHEPASQYRIPKLQGHKEHVNGSKKKVGIHGAKQRHGMIGPKSTTTSVFVGRGSIQDLPSLDSSRVASPFKKPMTPSIATSMDAGRPSTRHISLDPDRKDLPWGLDDLAHVHEETTRPDSIASGEHSTIWGLDDLSDDDDHMIKPNTGNQKFTYDSSATSRNGSFSFSKGASAPSSYMAKGITSPSSYAADEEYSGSEYSDDTETDVQRENWPLPLGTLKLS